MHNSKTTLVAGKIRNNLATFEDAKRLMKFIYDKGIESTNYGVFIHDEYHRLYPKPEFRPIDYSMLDHY